MEDILISLYCLVDDFCKEFIPQWQQYQLEHGLKKRRRKGQLNSSEVITICIHFHQSHYRDFKHYYLAYVTKHLAHLFPQLVSYTRFVTLTKSIIVPLCAFLQTLKGEKTGIYFIDSMLMKVCHIKREKQHRVFKGLAKKSKSTIGWFFGFKLHLVINEQGEWMACQLTAGNVDDRKPVPHLMNGLMGKLIGDKGYISKELFTQLFSEGLQLITRLKKNMKNQWMPLVDKLLLRKRAVIESANNQLKNKMQIEHTRHRSVWNFIANTFSAICSYALQPKKPSLRTSGKFIIL